jgi:hypothetical protein
MEDFDYDSDKSDDLSLSLNINDDNDKYVIKANVCTILSKQLKLPKIHYEYMGEYEPPKTHGLSNANVIIPKYYNIHLDPTKIININYYDIIRDDIRNCRVLNEYQLQYIKNLPSESKDELFTIFNDCLKFLNEVVETMN